MKLDCYQIDAGRKLTPCNLKSAITAAKDPEAKIWLDVKGGEKGELEDLLGNFSVGQLALRLCLDARNRPGFYPLTDYIFLVIPVEAEAADFRDVEYVSFLCCQRFLLTFRNPRDSRLQNITTQHEAEDWLPDGSIAGFVSSFIMLLSLETLQQLSEMRESISSLEKRMDIKPNPVDMNEISNIRSRLLTLEAVVSGQMPSFQALMTTDKSFFRLDNAREYLASAMANLQAADRSVHWLQGRMDVVRSEFEMQSQDKMNRRLGRLTILSLIFMPMTFLAGIWGMNFEHMPELSNPYGYLMALSSMILMGTSMFFYFRKRGWFE